MTNHELRKYFMTQIFEMYLILMQKPLNTESQNILTYHRQNMIHMVPTDINFLHVQYQYSNCLVVSFSIFLRLIDHSPVSPTLPYQIRRKLVAFVGDMTSVEDVSSSLVRILVCKHDNSKDCTRIWMKFSS